MAITARQTTTLALAHALSAAERGLPVIPLTARKLPALPSPHRSDDRRSTCRGACGLPGHGVHDATTDPAAVRALFAAAPWATGYGIACGRPPHHLIGIDLDIDTTGSSDSAASLRRLALHHLFTIPPTVMVLTPSGGRHIWLTGPPGVPVPNSASRLAPGIDIRGAGGYLVGPGSVTPRGRYRLAPGTAGLPPARCPLALLRLLMPPVRRRPGAADRPDRGRGLVRPGPGTGPLRPRGTRGPAQHTALLGGLPRLRTRLRRRPGGRPHPRRRPHRPHRTRGPRHDRIGGPSHHGRAGRGSRRPSAGRP